MGLPMVSFYIIAMHSIAYTHITQYILLLHSTYRIQMLQMHIFGMNVAFCIDLIAIYQAT